MPCASNPTGSSLNWQELRMRLNCYGSIKLKLEKDETRSMEHAAAPAKRPRLGQKAPYKDERA